MKKKKTKTLYCTIKKETFLPIPGRSHTSSCVGDSRVELQGPKTCTDSTQPEMKISDSWSIRAT